MSEDNVKFFVCGDTTPPVRAAGFDAGVDVFVPNLTEKFVMDLTSKNPGHPFKWGIIGTPVENEENIKQNEGLYIYLSPGEDLLIPTYLKTRFPNDMYLKVANKSGVCTKQKLVVGADTIDSSYEGICHVHVFNASNSMRFIEFGQAIAQFIPIKIDNKEIEIVFDESLENFKDRALRSTSEAFYEGHESKRHEKGFGEGNPEIDKK